MCTVTPHLDWSGLFLLGTNSSKKWYLFSFLPNILALKKEIIFHFEAEKKPTSGLRLAAGAAQAPDNQQDFLIFPGFARFLLR